MSETTKTTTKKGKSKGFPLIPRFFSNKAARPYDSVNWETRDAAIKNHTGEAIFEQKGVEFPSDFSQTAINVVASKYFYGDVNSKGDIENGGREHSFFQLAHRVCENIRVAGVEQGYFTGEESAVFYDEMMWLVLNQYGAFNSPVWFNFGLNTVYGIEETKKENSVFGWMSNGSVRKVDAYKRPQGSACFIISARDSIEGIMEMQTESARLFKYGSGVGADWSRLRSTLDKLSGGGTPSGPVSFMEVQDAVAKTIKSGGKTRRAAIMQTLHSWHPDVLDFIRTKATEERKAWALIEQGYDGSFNGPAYGSVGFQNVNQSVRVDDAFMEAATAPSEEEQQYNLRSPDTGDVLAVINAKDALLEVSEGTHVCGDPGLQYDDAIQSWHTCKASDRIWSSNPCSEYLFLDDSACNLASLNLVKFYDPEKGFDVVRFKAAVDVFLTAQEIIVDAAGYPSKKIAENSHKYRPLGLGFANLGALLMRMGRGYDSNSGRSVAAAIMAIEHCEAYAHSARMAAMNGPFEGYEKNKESFLEVIAAHAQAVEDVSTHGRVGRDMKVASPRTEMSAEEVALWEAARECANDMVDLGKIHGYRNAQVTVLAPTGTIGFMMDCDTTGIEPDLALVKYKLLAGKGEGMIKIVNQSVPSALAKLGYTEEQSERIIDYISETGTIEGAPDLADSDVSVFDCSFKPQNGERSLSYSAHIKMMAACQPFISGAISKTVNLPEGATVEDIFEAYVDSWKMGLKAVAVYRENSKRSQPLSTSTEKKTVSVETAEQASVADVLGEEFETFTYQLNGTTHPVYVDKGFVEEYERMTRPHTPKRERLPDERPALNHKFSVAGHEGYINIGMYPEGHPRAGRPGEVFITMAKQGSTIAGLVDSLATAISLAIQYGVPLDDLVSKFEHVRYEPAGFTNNPQIPMAKSLTDYIARYLDVKFLNGEGDGPDSTFGDAHEPVIADEPKAEKAAPKKAGSFQNQEDAPACSNCGGITVRAGSCYSCPNCGSSTGCG
jgi:ribonucleoside-diphosphate reductase alpha chain